MEKVVFRVLVGVIYSVTEDYTFQNRSEKLDLKSYFCFLVFIICTKNILTTTTC